MGRWASVGAVMGIVLLTASCTSTALDATTTLDTPASAVSASALCDMVAHGGAGVPRDHAEPLLVVRYSSYWSGYTSEYAPALVIYQDGTVAKARLGGNDGSDARSGDGRPSPFRSYLGGKFAECAVQQLVREFEVLAHTDLGDTHTYDCTEATLERYEAGRSAPTAKIYLNGFGCESDTVRYASDEQRTQRAARDRLVDWVERAGTVREGRGLPMDTVLVMRSEFWNPSPAANRPVPVWTARPIDREQGCTLFEGAAAADALAQVAAAIDANPGVQYNSDVYTAAWIMAGRQTRLAVMVTPPGFDCERDR